MRFNIAQKYLYGSILLASHVSISEKNVAPALAQADHAHVTEHETNPNI